MAVLTRFAALTFAAVLGAAPAGAAEPGPHAHAHRTIATASPAAQAAFDRALAFLYAFNVGEARVGFRAAEALDPHAAAAYFGEAMADTIDINLPTTPEGERRGADAVKRGLALDDLSADDRALLEVAAQRFAPGKLTMSKRFRAFFTAMQAYADAHPADGMAHTIAAYAGWLAVDDLIDAAGALTPDARTMRADLDASLALDADDLGARHLSIHFWEEAGAPARALPDAEYLASLSYDPGESHLAHMSGHTFVRIGDYARVVESNVRACENDATYFAAGDGPGQQYMRDYHEHDVAFVLYGLTTVGRNAEAIAFAAAQSRDDRARVFLRLHRDRDVLSLGETGAYRALAEARLGNVAAAERDLAGLASGSGRAALVARAAILLAKSDADGAAALLRPAYDRIARERELGDPKTAWETPIGETYGKALLAAGRFREAERVFRDELVRYPNDPRLEFGEAEALRAQQTDDSAARAAAERDWKGDAPLTRADLG